MGISSTTELKCDYVKEGKKCGKVFFVPDPPSVPTKGVENSVRVIDANGTPLFFCSWLHLVAHGVQFIKATPALELDTKREAPKKVIPTVTQIDKLIELGIIEKQAPTEDDLNLGDL